MKDKRWRSIRGKILPNQYILAIGPELRGDGKSSMIDLMSEDLFGRFSDETRWDNSRFSAMEQPINKRAVVKDNVWYLK